MMSALIRHITPGLGELPRDVRTDACSGLVGAALNIAQAQADLGHRTQILGWNRSSGPGSWKLGPVEAHAVSEWSWARAGGYDFRVMAPLMALGVRRGRSDIIHAYSDPHPLLLRRAGIRLLHLQTPAPQHPARSYSWLVNRADGVICCSEFIRTQFLERVDYPSFRTHVVTNGVDPIRFSNAEGAGLRASWGVDDETPIVLFAGAVTPEKGLLVLLRAAARLQRQVHFHIVVAGSAALWALPGQQSDDTEDEYTRLVRSVSGDLNITWLGAVPALQMPGIYAAANIFVCPSTWDEPFGMVACEAMAAGKPVIASRRGGLPEIVQDGETGLLVPSDDVEALRSAMERLFTDSALARTMGANAQSRSELFSWSKIARQLETIYQELGRPPEERDSRVKSSRFEEAR